MSICTVDDCDKPVDARGYCSTHYQRWQAHGDPLRVLKPYDGYVKPTCSVDDCDSPALARGWCRKHYQRWKKHGNPLIVKVNRDMTLEQRFWIKVDKNGPVPAHRPDLGPCWVWTGATAEGYGVIQIDGGPFKAHILSYTWAKGDIAEGQERDHLCRNRPCVRPDHLEAVTHWTNVARGISPHGKNAVKTHCPQGHPYDEENTFINSQGSRTCRICARAASMRAYYRRQSASE
jgi:hypothetical protein